MNTYFIQNMGKHFSFCKKSIYHIQQLGQSSDQRFYVLNLCIYALLITENDDQGLNVISGNNTGDIQYIYFIPWHPSGIYSIYSLNPGFHQGYTLYTLYPGLHQGYTIYTSYPGFHQGYTIYTLYPGFHQGYTIYTLYPGFHQGYTIYILYPGLHQGYTIYIYTLYPGFHQGYTIYTLYPGCQNSNLEKYKYNSKIQIKLSFKF